MKTNLKESAKLSHAIVEENAEANIKKLFIERARNDLNSTTLANTLNKDLETVFHDNEKFLLELLQNADDAGLADRFVDIHFQVKSNYLLFSHNGKHFDWHDVQAICDNAQQNLRDKIVDIEKTGYKGIGFKSVFVISDCVYILSKQYRFRFDKYFPQWQVLKSIDTRYPWQIIPIWTHHEALPLFITLDDINVNFLLQLKEGVNLAKVFDSLLLNPAMLLFLRRVQSIRIDIEGKVQNIYINRSNPVHAVEVNGVKTQWLLFKKNFELPNAIQMKLQKMGNHECPQKLKQASHTQLTFAAKLVEGKKLVVSNSKLFCYLPTDVNYGLPFLVNANFLLSADRMQLLKNEWNEFLLNVIGFHHIEWLAEIARDSDFCDHTLELFTSQLAAGVDIRFSKAYTIGVEKALNIIDFIPSAHNRDALMKFHEAVVDNTEFFKHFPNMDTTIEQKLVRHQLRKKDKLPGQFGLKEFGNNLATYAGKIQDLVEHKKLLQFVMRLYTQKSMASSYSSFAHTSHYLCNKAFVLSCTEKLVAPDEIRISRNNPNVVYPDFLNIHFLHPVLLEIEGICDWLKWIGAKEITDSVILDDVIRFFKQHQKQITQDKEIAKKISIDIISCLGKLDLHENNVKKIKESLSSLHLLTSNRQLRPAKQCYLPTAFKPEVDLQSGAVGTDVFVSTEYSKYVTDLDKLQYVLKALGVGSDIVLKKITINQTTDPSTIDYYKEYFEYLKTKDNVQFFGSRYDFESSPYLNHMSLLSCPSYANIFWKKVVEHDKEIVDSIKEFYITVASNKYSQTWPATPYLVFILSAFPCILCSDNQLYKITEVYSPALVKQLGRRLGKNILQLQTDLEEKKKEFSQDLASALGFKQILSINDCLVLLKFAANDDEKYVHQNFSQIYKLLCNHDEMMKGDYELLRKGDITLLAADDTLQPSGKLYCLPKEVLFEPLRSQVLIKPFPELKPDHLQKICQIFSIQTLLMDDLTICFSSAQELLGIKEEMQELLKLGAIITSCKIERDKKELFQEWTKKLASIKFMATENLVIELKGKKQSICQPRVFYDGHQLYYETNYIRFKENILKTLCKIMKIKQSVCRELASLLGYSAEQRLDALRDEGYDIYSFEELDINASLALNSAIVPQLPSPTDNLQSKTLISEDFTTYSGTMTTLKKYANKSGPDENVSEIALKDVMLIKQDLCKKLSTFDLMTSEVETQEVKDAYNISDEKHTKLIANTHQKAKKSQSSSIENDWSGRWGEEVVYYKLKGYYLEKYPLCVFTETTKGFTLAGKNNENNTLMLEVIWHNKVSESGNSVDFEIIKNTIRRFVEVKSTYKSNNMTLRITKNEWNIMRTQGDRYRFFCVYNAGKGNGVKIIKLKDPWRHLMTGELSPQETVIKLKSL